MAAVSHTAETTDKLKLPGWSAATFKDNRRRLENVELVHALVIDFDNTIKVKRPDGTTATERLADDKLVMTDRAMDVRKVDGAMA